MPSNELPERFVIKGKAYLRGTNGVPDCHLGGPLSQDPSDWWWEEGVGKESNFWYYVNQVREMFDPIKTPTDPEFRKAMEGAQDIRVLVANAEVKAAENIMRNPETDAMPDTPLSPSGEDAEREAEEKRLAKVPENLRPYAIKKGQVLNPHGAPKRGLTQLNDELRAKGYMPLTRDQVTAHYLTMLALPLPELKSLATDDAKPMIARVLAKSILNGKGIDIIEKMLDRAIGKPAQRNELTGADGGAVKVENADVGAALASVLADFNARHG